MGSHSLEFMWHIIIGLWVIHLGLWPVYTSKTHSYLVVPVWLAGLPVVLVAAILFSR